MSSHEMGLLLEEDPMSVDGSIQGIQGIEGIEGMEGMENIGDMGGMGSAMALDDVDLFGDAVMEGALAGLPPRPLPSKHLQQRLDELRTRGCCQGIAWSRQGTVASIAKDGMSVELRYLRCNPDTAEWELSEPTSWSPPSPSPSPPTANLPTAVPPAAAAAPFVHLAWAPTMNPDLAVVDALGRITILSFHIAVNQTYPVRRWETDVVDDLHAIVGCYWLPLGMPPNKQASRLALSAGLLLTLSKVPSHSWPGY
jgi:mediator of RNA polymerase II transcription subunit 16, fungi type